jgi:ectoine hydroxylase-related dioxygenase (phytanoyl-CoA dioxygenase family)
MTELNGATEIIPGSHLWDGEIIEGAVNPADFASRVADRETFDRIDAMKMTMPSGSLAITKGTLWHRGGANCPDSPRLIITPQYCAGWVRQLENMCLAVPAKIAKHFPNASASSSAIRSIRLSWVMSTVCIRSACCGPRHRPDRRTRRKPRYSGANQKAPVDRDLPTPY